MNSRPDSQGYVERSCLEKGKQNKKQKCLIVSRTALKCAIKISQIITFMCFSKKLYIFEWVNKNVFT